MGQLYDDSSQAERITQEGLNCEQEAGPRELAFQLHDAGLWVADSWK